VPPAPIVKLSSPSWTRPSGVTIGAGGTGQVTDRLHRALVAIQRGQAPDPHGWMHRLG